MRQITVNKNDVDVCLILRNEEQFIETCLQRVKDSFETVVVLDMGSKDRTVEIVNDIFGGNATVLSQPREVLFEKGFAYARNVVTAAARKPWVLHVDADEFLTPNGTDVIAFAAPEDCDFAARVVRRNLVEQPGVTFDALSLSRLPTTSVEEHVRLYRPTAHVRWESFLHEEIWIGDHHGHDRVGTADLILDHVSAYRPFAERSEKELFYAWILMKVHENKDLQKNMRSYYVNEYMAENMERFRGMAQKFASQHCLEAR